MTAPIPVMTLEYSHPQTLGSPAARAAFGWMVVLSILSGLCVAVCFLSFTETVVAWVIHTLVFAATIAVAIKSGASFMQLIPASDDPGRALRLSLDVVALAGVAAIGVSPWVYSFLHANSLNDSSFAGLLGVAYLLLTVTTWRHVMFYRLLAGVCRGISRDRVARGLVALGWFKAIYEFLWLGSCAMTMLVTVGKSSPMFEGAGEFVIYFAVGALFGILGYGVIWMWMIVAHAQLYRLGR